MPDKPSKTAGRLRSFVQNVSCSAWIAWATFGCLALLTLFGWILAWRNPLWVPWGAYVTPGRGVLLLGLAIAACLAEYMLLRLWFDELPLSDRDLQAGWEAGLRGLRREGIEPSSRPCFLLLDPADACERWFDAVGAKVQRHATSDSPVRWFHGDEALFVVVQGLGWSGPLTTMLDEVRRRPSRYVMTSTARRTVASPSAVAVGPEGAAVPDVDQSPPETDDSEQIDAEAVREELLGPFSTTESAASLSAEIDEGSDTAELSDPRVPSHVIARESRRLADVCRRLAACRRPVVPLNGICVLLPSGLPSHLVGSGVRLGEALRHDLQLLQRQLQVTAPVSVVLTDAEEDAGIVELIRRSGRERAAAGELGLTSGPSRANGEGLERFRGSLSESLRKGVGRVFRDPRWVGRPGADRLFRLLSDLRGERGRELQALVTQAFTRSGEDEPEVLAGLSLVATGEQPPKRAFARATYRSLLDNHEFVQWTAAGIRRERWQWWLAGAFGSLSVAAAGLLITMLLAGR